MTNEPDRVASRLFDFCVGILLAAMALYGAVAIISSIWLALCLAALAVCVGAGSMWILLARFRRW